MAKGKSEPRMEEDRLVSAGTFTGGVSDGEPCPRAARVSKGLKEGAVEGVQP